MRAEIKSLATYVPPRLLTNADLEKLVETSNEWIMQRTGIRERHIVDAGVATSDLAAEAALAAIAKADDPGGVFRDVGLMSHENDRQPGVAIQPLEDAHDFDRRSRVEIASRLVGEEQRWLVDERTRDCDALLLAAG